MTLKKAQKRVGKKKAQVPYNDNKLKTEQKIENGYDLIKRQQNWTNDNGKKATVTRKLQVMKNEN